MTNESKIFWGAVAATLLVLVVIVLSPKVKEELAPRPLGVRLAIELPGEPAAEGRFELAAGTPFTLHAVLEAETRDGERVYYTEAERLHLDGREVPPESLRRWQRSDEVRVLWFTVEGYTPHLEEAGAEEFAAFRFREFFRPEWPRAWAVPGSLEPAGEQRRPPAPETGLPRFGTQRFHVRVEFFGPESEITPRERFTSTPAADLPAAVADFPTVSAELPGGLAVPSGFFGLPHIDLLPGLPAETATLAGWARQRLAFSRLAVLREMLDRAGLGYDDLDWRSADLEAGDLGWGAEGAEPGDLLRVGERLVVLLQDRGGANILDGEDLCLDFSKGAAVRPLNDIFIGEGLVEWAALRVPAGGERATGGA